MILACSVDQISLKLRPLFQGTCDLHASSDRSAACTPLHSPASRDSVSDCWTSAVTSSRMQSDTMDSDRPSSRGGRGRSSFGTGQRGSQSRTTPYNVSARTAHRSLARCRLVIDLLFAFRDFSSLCLYSDPLQHHQHRTTGSGNMIFSAKAQTCISPHLILQSSTMTNLDFRT